MASGREASGSGQRARHALPPLACVYATDRGFLPVTCFSIASLAANAGEPITITVLSAGISDADIAAAQTWLGTRGVTASFIAIPADAFAGLPRPKALPLSTYGRLVMDRLLPADLRRVLYVDGDTLVVGSVFDGHVMVCPLADS